MEIILMPQENNVLSKKPNEKKSLRGLLTAQFFGAFNDNAWKVMLFTLATRQLLGQSADASFSFETSSQFIATLSLVVFLLPMMLLSLPAGALADQMSKKSLIIWTKILELILMAASTVSLYLAPSQLFIPFILLGLMGAQSALFAPAKYGILPEILPKEKLSRGNGILEMWTMIAIIVGTGLGPLLLAADHGGIKASLTWLGPLWLTLLSSIGLAGTFFISKVPSARNQSYKVTAAVQDAWKTVKSDRVLWLAVIGSMLYWSMTCLIGQNVLVYAKVLVREIEKGELFQGIPPASYGMGIALGAFFSGRLSGNRIEYGLIPLGAIGFALSSLLLGLIQPEMIGTVILLLLMGLSSGLLIVPLHAILQWRAADQQRGSIIALGNFLDIIGMLTGSLIAAGMALLGFGLKTMLIASACLIILATIWSIKILPKALVRLCFIILTRTSYRLKIIGFENLPKEGSILLVANHISVIDALFVMASVDRPVRFMMMESYYNTWYLHPLAKLMDAIPVSNSAGTRGTLQGMRAAAEALDNGELVCIFPEGQISHTGKMLPFRRGIELITKGKNCAIVPIHIGNAWGSIFTFKNGKFFKKWPRPLQYKLTIAFGKSLQANTSAVELRRVVQEMECDAWFGRKEEQVPIHHQFIQNARKHPIKLAIADKDQKIPGWKTLALSIAIARQLRAHLFEQSRIGILLPTTISAILVNIAITLSKRVSVNINFNSGNEGINKNVEQAELKTVISSRNFLEKTKISLPEEIKVLYIEDLLNKISFSTQCAMFLVGLFTPISLLEKLCGGMQDFQIDTPLTIIFTSGSTGDPKGVVLSHFNLSSNVESISQVIPPLGKKKNMLASLPFYHSFGYMMMWLGLTQKIGLITHSNPQDAKIIGELVKKYDVKLMMSTPTLLRGYIKQVLPNQFGSLQCVIAGAEKLSQQLADTFETSFGVRPIEGYGTTECSPVIATSTLDVRQSGIYQVGNIQGSVGQALPGVTVKVVDPITYEEIPSNTQGVLLVKGPNVMKGYLNRDDLTQQVMHQGWYITGDMAQIDENGFITITDRLRRISKIHGELVSHSKLEEALHLAAEVEEPFFAVTSIPFATH
jgi:acyl-[acyl-carrier-protein]-phospholipid O-acyltransferase / long-chain-fatty-acid--[acyl-carrier-protein] ligase